MVLLAEMVALVVGAALLLRRWLVVRRAEAWARTEVGMATWYAIASRRGVR